MAQINSPDYNSDDPMYNSYAKKLAQQQQQNSIDSGNIQSQASNMSQVADQTGSSTDVAPSTPFDSKAASKGFQQGMSGGLGAGMMTAGVASMNPYLVGAGLVVSVPEGNAKAKQAQAQAQAEEAQMRKQQQLSSINQLISVSKGLGV